MTKYYKPTGAFGPPPGCLPPPMGSVDALRSHHKREREGETRRALPKALLAKGGGNEPPETVRAVFTRPDIPCGN